MQIDFHHSTTYVLARLAKLSRPEAEIIAFASQYVDDATSSGTVYFENKALYNRISSAHKMIDIRNTKALANHQVWLPFHFLPGNGGKGTGNDPTGKFITKIVCKPNSFVARQMVKDAILQKDRDYGLHRFGIAMHVYADTWAHQEFAGVIHRINEVENAREIGKSGVFGKGLIDILRDFLDDAIPPLGHGRATVFPDMPFLKWEYKNGMGNKIVRNNTNEFCKAAQAMFKAMKRFKVGDPSPAVEDIHQKDMDQIRSLFRSVKEEDGEKRHEEWLKAIRTGKFSFGPETVKYAARGKRSWKHQALGSSYDLPVHSYDRNFLKSNWKLFHDAVQAHRFYVIHDLLPKYHICAA